MYASLASAYGVFFRFLTSAAPSGTLGGVTGSSSTVWLATPSPLPFPGFATLVSSTLSFPFPGFPFPGFPFPCPFFSAFASLVAATRSLCACGVHGVCLPKHRFRTSPGIPEIGSFGAMWKGSLIEGLNPKRCAVENHGINKPRCFVLLPICNWFPNGKPKKVYCKHVAGPAADRSFESSWQLGIFKLGWL